MIEFSKKQQATTFLALLRCWEVPPELRTSEAVSRHAMAQLLAFHIDDAPGVMAATMVLQRVRHLIEQDERAPHRYWALDIKAVEVLVGSREGAVLAAQIAGYWPKADPDGAVEWSDCTFAGGPRNLIDVSQIGDAA